MKIEGNMIPGATYYPGGLWVITGKASKGIKARSSKMHHGAMQCIVMQCITVQCIQSAVVWGALE